MGNRFLKFKFTCACGNKKSVPLGKSNNIENKRATNDWLHIKIYSIDD
jgi:hypothetical protein